MKKYTILIFGLLIMSIRITAQEFNTRGTGNQAQSPSVMVVPYINSELDNDAVKLRTYIDENPMIKLCMNKVQEAFSLKGYPTKDFVGLLRRNQNRRLLSTAKSASSSVAKSIVTQSKAAICVYMTPMITHNEDGTMEVRLTLEAQEAALGQNFANADFSSGRFRTTDSLRLAERALATISNNFFYQLEDGFNRMLSEGRDVSVLIEFAEGAEVGPYTKVGTNGKTLDREMMDWVRATAYNGSGDSQSGDGIIEMALKVPVYEVGTDIPFQIGLLGDMLLNHLTTLIGDLGTVELAINQGQNIQFIIK